MQYIIFRLRSKNVKIKECKSIILLIVAYEYGTWSLTLSEGHNSYPSYTCNRPWRPVVRC
jgi:hypothetical protein